MEDGKSKTPEPNLVKKEGTKISCGFYSVANEKHPGKNEDAALVNEKEKIFGVFDGIGGHAAGEVVSKAAASFISEHIEGLIPSGILVERAERLLVSLVNQLSAALQEQADLNPLYKEMKTTMSLVKIHENENGEFVLYINVGDSRIYKLNKDNELDQLSVDDDLLSESYFSPETKKAVAMHLAEAVSKEELDHYEQVLFHNRNLVSQTLPRTGQYYACSKIRIGTGDKILITSDGIHDNLTYTEITNILAGPGSDEDLAKKLVRKSVERSHDGTMRSKRDDMTAVVVSIK